MTVEELLDKKKLAYTHRGKDVLIKCINPEHEDSSPSLSIDKVTGIFKCFSCGFKGNIFSHYGEKGNKLHIQKELLKRKIVEKRSESVGLTMPKDAIPYLGGWRDIHSATYSKFEAFEHYDPAYIGRINFPVRDISGKIVAFIGRHTGDGDPRYNIVPPRAKMPLFPMTVETIKGRIMLVEGIFDMINLHDKGILNAVSCFGTNNISEDKLRIVRMRGISGVDIFFDGDKAGQEAAEKVKELCESVDLSYRNIYLEGTDPGALTKNQVLGLRRKLYES